MCNCRFDDAITPESRPYAHALRVVVATALSVIIITYIYLESNPQSDTPLVNAAKLLSPSNLDLLPSLSRWCESLGSATASCFAAAIALKVEISVASLLF